MSEFQSWDRHPPQTEGPVERRWEVERDRFRYEKELREKAEGELADAVHALDKVAAHGVRLEAEVERLNLLIDTKRQEAYRRAEAAEAEVERLREGLKEYERWLHLERGFGQSTPERIRLAALASLEGEGR